MQINGGLQDTLPKEDGKENAMRVIVDTEACTGCSLCGEICPNVFEVKDGVAKVKINPIPGEEVEACSDAESECPGGAITTID